MEGWMQKIKSVKKDQILILFLLGVLLLVIAIPTGGESQPEAAAETEAEIQTKTCSTKTQELEARLEAILSQVEGIGQVRAMLTLKSDGQKIVEKDMADSQEKEESTDEAGSSSSSRSDTSESTIYQKDAQGNEVPYVTEELEPEISGVLVIAQGAGSASVVTEITEAVMALFGVEAHKIKVMKME